LLACIKQRAVLQTLPSQFIRAHHLMSSQKPGKWGRAGLAKSWRVEQDLHATAVGWSKERLAKARTSCTCSRVTDRNHSKNSSIVAPSVCVYSVKLESYPDRFYGGIRSRPRRLRGMVFGMAASKITITLHDDQVKEIRALVEAGQAASVSAFVQHAVGVALSDAAGWREMLKDALQQTGGALTKKERAWADAVLSSAQRKRSGKKGKAA
jgi:Arc/MetJ-type ribon-helix-helix transcriptional regulator